jgi:hypothetical protein
MSSCPLDEDENRGHKDINGIDDISFDSEDDSFAACSEDREVEYQERAGIMEYDGGLIRIEAERLAALEIFQPSNASSNAA